jgi:ADP-heptose:LPS heptosyltransferase
MEKINPERINAILISRLRFMGDVILTTPLLAALRQRFPHVQIGYLLEKPFDQLLEGHPYVDEIFALQRGDDRNQLALIQAMRRRKWDVAIDLFGNPRSALLLYLSGAHWRIGGNFRGRRLLYTHRIADAGRRMTAIEFHLRYLAPLGINAQAPPTHIAITQAELVQARRYLETRGYDLTRPIIGIHPGATWPAKRWFPERFAALATRLVNENQQLLFTMGPGEEDIIARIFSAVPQDVAKPEILPLRRLAALLAQLEVFVSNDCGPLHLAPAVGTKTVGIFGPGEPDIWFPYDPAFGHRLVYHALDCSLCHRDLCPDMACMRSISVDDVHRQICSALTAAGTKKAATN